MYFTQRAKSIACSSCCRSRFHSRHLDNLVHTLMPIRKVTNIPQVTIAKRRIREHLLFFWRSSHQLGLSFFCDSSNHLISKGRPPKIAGRKAILDVVPMMKMWDARNVNQLQQDKRILRKLFERRYLSMKKTSAFVHWETGRVFEEPVSTKKTHDNMFAKGIATHQASFVMEGAFFFFFAKNRNTRRRTKSTKTSIVLSHKQPRC